MLTTAVKTLKKVSREGKECCCFLLRKMATVEEYNALEALFLFTEVPETPFQTEEFRDEVGLISF